MTHSDVEISFPLLSLPLADLTTLAWFTSWRRPTTWESLLQVISVLWTIPQPQCNICYIVGRRSDWTCSVVASHDRPCQCIMGHELHEFMKLFWEDLREIWVGLKTPSSSWCKLPYAPCCPRHRSHKWLHSFPFLLLCYLSCCSIKITNKTTAHIFCLLNLCILLSCHSYFHCHGFKNTGYGAGNNFSPTTWFMLVLTLLCCQQSQQCGL